MRFGQAKVQRAFRAYVVGNLFATGVGTVVCVVTGLAYRVTGMATGRPTGFHVRSLLSAAAITAPIASAFGLIYWWLWRTTEGKSEGVTPAAKSGYDAKRAG